MADVKFKPCVIFHEDGGYTEMVLRDVPMVWRAPVEPVIDLGYDAETGELVAIRILGRVHKIERT